MFFYREVIPKLHDFEFNKLNKDVMDVVEEQELDITKLNSLKVDQNTISGQLASKLKKLKESSIFIKPFEAVIEDNMEDDEIKFESEEIKQESVRAVCKNESWKEKEEVKQTKRAFKSSTFWMQKKLSKYDEFKQSNMMIGNFNDSKIKESKKLK